ncbi:MAG: sigma-54-dependent Fis family transcriptional regulator [Bdellovibrionales bacterium]|nr:sigma-54-dependent Fis family transcriptional regulator [Bdellovibrionales bacterium]
MSADGKEIKILIVDDEEPIRRVLSDSLRDDGFTVEVAADGRSGIVAAKSFQPQIMLLDIWMPGDLDGIGVLESIKTQFPEIQVVMMSGHGTIETAVKATKMGAWDFVEKPLSMDKISILISNILAFQSEKTEKRTLLNRLRDNIAIIGVSQPVKELKEKIAKVAPTKSSVLITGPNGTGKELVAQNLHYLSDRIGGPFVEINSAAIPEDLIESELFGHEKGAFTGAVDRKLGKFELANKGTIFFDEIGDMSLKTQAKILRVLEEQKFERVGGAKTVGVDVRIIAATNKDLTAAVRLGQFREDLFHRLNVIPFHVAPLAQRVEDIPPLTIHFSQIFARIGGRIEKQFSTDSFDLLKKYGWPGNIRELKNFIERIYILWPNDIVTPEALELAGLKSDPSGGMDLNTDLDSLREARAHFEKQFIIKKLEENRGNISKTAEVIGLERSHLHRKIKAFGIDVREGEA